MTIYIPYFYIIQDVRNGMYYAGSKYGKGANPSDFMIEGGYATHSKTIKELIRRHGMDNFIIRKIITFETGPEAHDYETKFLQKVDARNHLRFYNGHNNDWILSPKKMKLLMMERYGVSSSLQNPETREKRSITMKERYGVLHPIQSDTIKSKMTKTMRERYSVDWSSQCPEIRSKIAKTTKERYGVDHAAQSEVIQNKIKETNIDRYGVEYPTQSEEVMNKLRETNFEKYGVGNVFQADEVKEKIKSKNLEIMGVENPFQSEEIKNNIRAIMYTRHNRSEVKEIKEYVKKFKVKLKKSWNKKSDEFIQTLLNDLKKEYGEI